MPEIGDIEELYSSPKAVEWTILNFFLLPKQVGYLVASPKFNFQEYTCRLIALPNGTENLPEVMMVTLTGIGKSGTVKWELEIRRTDGTTLRKCGGTKSDGCEVEMSMLIPYKEVRIGCYVRNLMRITCTLYNEDDIRKAKEERKFKATGIQTETTSRADKLSSDFEDLFFRQDDTDITIRVQGREFKAHKCILGARTPVFTSMFKHKMSENITGVVEIDDCDAVAFGEFLHYLYTGRVDFSPSTVFNLYKTADKYQANELKDYSMEYIKNNLSVEILCDAIILSVQYENEELMDLAVKFLSENMTEILDTEKWQDFLCENPTESNRLLLEALKLQKEDGGCDNLN